MNVLSHFLSLNIMQRFKILIVLPFIHWMLEFYVLSYLKLAAEITTYLSQFTSASLAWFVFSWMARPVSLLLLGFLTFSTTMDFFSSLPLDADLFKQEQLLDYLLASVCFQMQK